MSDSSPIFRLIIRFLAIPILCASQGAAGFATDWSQFRGARVDGKTSDVSIPSGSFRLEPTWKVPIGSGYSSLSIGEGKVVTGDSDGTDDFFVCLSEETGEVLWRRRIGPMYVGHDGSHDGPISTPAIHDGKVFGLGPWGRLLALDLETGSVLWSKDLTRTHDAPKPHYGFTASPFLLGDSLVLLLGAPGAAVAAFDLTTGDLQWSCGSSAIQYQTAVPLEVDGKLQILAAGMSNLLGIDPEKGIVSWEFNHNGGGGRGSGSMVPVPAGEGRVYLSHRSEASRVIRLGTDDEGETEIQSLWENRSIYNSYCVPVHHEGYLYAFSARRLTCVDARTGERAWRSRLPGDGWVTLADDHLIVLTKEGGLHVIEATPDGYRPVTSTKIFSELAWSPPSLANGHIYVRSLAAAAKIALVPGEAPTEIVEAPETARSSREAATNRAFPGFLAKLEEDGADKAAVIERFLSRQETFPIVEGNRVHFVYRGEAKDLAIAGDMIGARQERRMTRVAGTDFYHHSLTLEPDARVNYVFVRDYESVVDPLNPRRTITTQYGEDMEVGLPGERMEMSWLSMPGWREPAHLQEPTGPRGTTETPRVESEILSTALPVTVYLPSGYGDSDRRYPVAYVHGGSLARSLGMYLHTLDNVIGKTVEPLIVVFIDLPYLNLSGAYDRVFGEEIVPFIDGTYRTVASREARASIGAGFEGLAAIQSGVLLPEIVSQVASQSAMIFEVFLPAIEERLGRASAEHPVRLYLEWGRYDQRNPHEAWDIGVSNARYARKLRDLGYEVEGREVNDGTGWSSWKNRTDLILRALFPLENR